jgi:hypothetical protein
VQGARQISVPATRRAGEEVSEALFGVVACERRGQTLCCLRAPTVPAPVLAQGWRGGAKQASLSRLLALCIVEPMSEAQARAVGRLASRSRHEDVVDLAVVEGTLRRRDAIVTSDAEDMRHIAAAVGERIRLEAV